MTYNVFGGTLNLTQSITTNGALFTLVCPVPPVGEFGMVCAGSDSLSLSLRSLGLLLTNV